MLLQSVRNNVTLSVLWLHQIQDFKAVTRVSDEELSILDVKRGDLELYAVAIHVLLHVLLGRCGLTNAGSLNLVVQLLHSACFLARVLLRQKSFRTIFKFFFNTRFEQVGTAFSCAKITRCLIGQLQRINQRRLKRPIPCILTRWTRCCRFYLGKSSIWFWLTVMPLSFISINIFIWWLAVYHPCHF